MTAMRLSLFLTAILLCPVIMAQTHRKAVVSHKAAPGVLPFGYSEVTLLDSPFLAARDRTAKVLLTIEPDRLLHTFRLNAGLPSVALPLGGWEAPDIEVRGHTIGHYLTACALMYANTGDERFRDRTAYIVSELGKVRQALAGSASHPGYLSAFPEEFIDRVEQRKRVWAPYYTLHKIMAGLLDAYLHCGNAEALDVVNGMAGWVRFRMDRLTKEQQQDMLQTEFGGMNDILARLYAVTGDADHLRLATAFDHEAVFGTLSQGLDSLDGLHGNTQIPKMIGAMREYELTGDERYRRIASFFWERVSKARAYVIGGNTNDERFTPVGQMAFNLGTSSTETCNSYNMLKLTRGLFSHDADARYMDFYERVLYNHILASQDPSTGMYCYYVSLKPGAYKTYSTVDSSFWCCVGTGMENPERYVEAIYAHDDASLFVNLFIPSEVRWDEKKAILRQETGFPRDGRVRFTMVSTPNGTMALRVRVPAWVSSRPNVTINGSSWKGDASPGSYLTIERTWAAGDNVELVLPIEVSVELMADDPSVVSFLRGPVVLAGDLGTEGIHPSTEYGPEAPAVHTIMPAGMPVLVAPSVDAVRTLLRSDMTIDAAVPHGGTVARTSVRLLPFPDTHHRQYSVYWRVMDPKELAAHAEMLRRESEWWTEVERNTIDAVDVNDGKQEHDHAFMGNRSSNYWYDGRKGREARGGSFSYVLRVEPGAEISLVCTYRGSEGIDRRFDIVVGDSVVAAEDLGSYNPEIIRVEYSVPQELTSGKENISVVFSSVSDAFAGPVFEVRTVRRSGP